MVDQLALIATGDSTGRLLGSAELVGLALAGGFSVIAGYAMTGLDAMQRLFFWGGVTGGVGPTALILRTSIAVIGFFNRDRRGINPLAADLTRAVGALALGFMVYQAVDCFTDLLGPGTNPLTGVLLLDGFAVAAIMGVGWGLLLKATRPRVYEAIGLGTAAVVSNPRASLPGRVA
jgi:hypothetical protein